MGRIQKEIFQWKLKFPNAFYPNSICITMGRKRLNRTKEEIREQNRIRQRRFYERHSKRIKKEKLKKYYNQKEMEKKLPQMWI